MRIPPIIIDSLSGKVRQSFLYWAKYMETDLSFSLPDSRIHAKGHSERVLLYALLLREQVSGSMEKDNDVLGLASIFHDTRRWDDFLDTGHGARAAAYFKSYCEASDDVDFSESAYLIMAYHDQDDESGIKAIKRIQAAEAERTIRLYRIFKDADALDRFRLGEEGLDVRFLRHQEAIRLIDFAKNLVRLTI